MSPAPNQLLVALGGGLNNQQPGTPPYMWIGDETRLRAAAAAKLWQQDPSALLIFSGGPQGNTPSEAATMQGYVEREPWNVPAANILTEDTSIDTASNVRNTVRIIQARGLSTTHVSLIAGISNVNRAAAYFKAYGIRVVPLLARPVLGADIQKYTLPNPSDAMSAKAKFHEFLLRLEQLIDRKGRLVTLFKQWQLDRQHNTA